MTPYVLLPESDAFASQILALHIEAFGPGRFARAAFRLREQGPHDAELSFIAVDDATGENLLGSVRQSWVSTGAAAPRGLLLGPLAVLPAHKKMGIGKALVGRCLQAAEEAGAAYVLLVGDAPYYAPLGFRQAPSGKLRLPGPVDPARLLLHPLGAAALPDIEGLVTHAELIQRRKTGA